MEHKKRINNIVKLYYVYFKHSPKLRLKLLGQITNREKHILLIVGGLAYAIIDVLERIEATE